MKNLKTAKFILILALVTIFANCSMNNNARITKLPEIINQDTGLREIRMRRYDCLYLAGEENPLDCANNEELVTEPVASQNETPKSSSATPSFPFQRGRRR